MARLKEFKGLRPVKDIAASVAELPYDVVNTAEARTAAGKSRCNFYHVTRSEVDLPEGINVYDEAVYRKGRENLEGFIKEGVLFEDESAKLYLYTLIMNGRPQTGLVACVHIDDYINKIIKKHELVLDSKAEDRKKHIDILNADTGLVFLFYKQDDVKKGLFERAMKIQPEYDFISGDDIRHIFRVISDAEIIKEFKDAFGSQILYIADGHHRAFSAVKVGLERKDKNAVHKGSENYNWFLAVIFPHNELMIMPYNRAVTDLNGMSRDAFLEKIKEKYMIEESGAPVKKHTFRMYLDGKWYMLIPRFEIPDDAIGSLDAQILHDTLLDPVLGIMNPKIDKRIDFVGGIRGEKELMRLVDSGKFRAAFSLHPVSIEELIRVSDEDKLMPPKSTWFEPKLRDGLVIYSL